MKKYYSLLLFLLFVPFTSGCSKDTVLLKEIAGTWQVSKITYKYSNGNSVVTGPDLGTFYFEECRWRREEDEACDGYYQFGNGKRTRYGYATFARSNRISFFLAPGEPEREHYSSVSSYQAAQAAYWGDQPRFNTIWDIVRRTDRELVISGTLVRGYQWASGPVLEWTEITLTR
jgi:hypothetical protein